MLEPGSHNPEEGRFVEELSRHFEESWYLRGIGVKGLGLRQLGAAPRRIWQSTAIRGRSGRDGVRTGSLLILPWRGTRSGGVNAWWLRRQLERLAGGATTDWTLWTRFPSPELVEAIADMRFRRVVYEPVDRYAAAANFTLLDRRRIGLAERRLMGGSTVVTAARCLAEELSGARGGSHWLPTGHDPTRLPVGTGVPASIPRPRLAVIGRLDWRVDEDLVRSLAIRRPDWSLVLAGPRVDGWGSTLEGLRNVHWFGDLPVEQALALVRDSDVGLVPYLVTDWTRACLPVKVFEYLGLGKPVVATHLPELALFGESVLMAPRETFDQAVEAALGGADSAEAQSRRRQVAGFLTVPDRARLAVELLQRPYPHPRPSSVTGREKARA